MILLNGWTEVAEMATSLIIRVGTQYWIIDSAETVDGYLAWTGYEDEEDAPVPKYYRYLRNGDRQDQDIETYLPGFLAAVHDIEAEVIINW